MRRRRPEDRVLARAGELVVERDSRRPSGRLLRQDGMEASYVDLADPRHLEFDYLRWIRIVLRAARARRVVHIGGGGCALARAMAAEDPAGRHEVCEIDPTVLAMAREHLGLRRARGLHVRLSDGRAWLTGQPDDGWDGVVIDAFQGAVIPPHLVSVEALRDIARVAPLVVVNVVDDRGRREVARVAGALGSAFPRIWTAGSLPGNAVLVGLAAPGADELIDRIRPALAADPSPAQALG